MIFHNNQAVRATVNAAGEIEYTGQTISESANRLANYLNSLAAGEENPDRVTNEDLARYRKDAQFILADLESYSKSLVDEIRECKRLYAEIP